VISPSTWIDVCYDGFTTEAAITICKQLGFVNYYDKKYSHNHNTSSSPAIRSVTCPTKSNYLLFGASHILRCVIGPVLNNSCSLVAMECEDKLLINQPYGGQVFMNHQTTVSKSSGIVHIYLDDQWNFICYDEATFNNNTGISICRQLGYTNMTNAVGKEIIGNCLKFNDFICTKNSFECFSKCFKSYTYEEFSTKLEVYCGFDEQFATLRSSGSKPQCELNYIHVNGLTIVTIICGIFIVFFLIGLFNMVICCIVFKKKGLLIFRCCPGHGGNEYEMLLDHDNDDKYCCICIFKKCRCNRYH
jgi:deleted-in-malignant-brain-tumors protein 1